MASKYFQYMAESHYANKKILFYEYIMTLDFFVFGSVSLYVFIKAPFAGVQER